ncbi:magnesium transporter [Sporosarcina sp. P21c]|uniref:magnesium transporter n=1 Tax=Sporosarcina TaxID=1569 RepID=UPI000A15BAF6|nr:MULTISPECIES: magnesium transporter [Sporosarcina]ARJ39858.1 magnesium transporter [Sporosarcina ureae]PIC66569.1 magnesium transporter [Sporosarcina sp. P16a]PIC81984.1 magnesium transporter [Sporosarcina sp. P1]PIC89940.1 magnesium transporter [Sporosarcina sp. P21c]PIC93134.1 magnesium transporter [Sporosarcina sp. P25]
MTTQPEQMKSEIVLDAVKLRELLSNEDIHSFRKEYLVLHPYDRATFYEEVGAELRELMYFYLSPKELAEIFETSEIEEDEYEEFLEEMDATYAAEMISYMFVDNAVDVLKELDKKKVVSYLTLMDKEAAIQIKALLHYEEYTAGSIMTTEFVTVSENSTVRSAMTILRSEAPSAETIYYIFVVDDYQRLTGVVSLRDLIIADEDTLIRAIMSDRLVSVSVSDDQEDVARTIQDYNFLAVPVVDFQQHILGIITVDDIIDVIDEEASDDYSKLAGVSTMDTFDKNPFSAAKKRIPWLLILLVLGMLTANLIDLFTETISQVALLAAFIPLIAGTAGNSGTQSLAVAVRGIATRDIEDESKLKLLIREAGTGIITGVICAIFVVLLIFIWKHELVIALLVGAAMMVSIFVATISGSFIPLFMHKLKVDPAVASGPFITTLNDVISVVIYLGLATVFLSSL